jgi:hypothetical protein
MTAIPSKLSTSTVLTTTTQGNAPSKWSTVITLNCGNTPAELRGLPASKNSRSPLFEHFAPPSPYKDGGRHGSEEQSGRSDDGAYRDDARYIGSARDWYLQDGTFDLKRVTGRWHEKLALASARGYAGVRVTGDTAWLEKKDWIASPS